MAESIGQHRIKPIKYGARTVPIALQDVNGPCPLLALSNVMLLRGDITIHTDRSFVSVDELMAMISDHMLARAPQFSDDGMKANHDQNISDAITMFPQLQEGLDVNVKFRHIHDFEFTKELVVFDMLNVSLVHGWLVDPQDAAYSTVSKLSYNQIVELIVNHQAKSDRLKQSAPARLERSSDSIGGSSFTSDQDLALLRTFLDDSASQLTYHGLMELHEKLKEQELAVFFRNNHFSVITKHSGRLYLLVTDQGYLHQGQIVWERLDEVEGDTVLVDSDFVPFRSNQSELAPDFAAEAQSGFALLAPADQGDEDPSLALARKMQEEEDLRLAQQLDRVSPEEEQEDSDGASDEELERAKQGKHKRHHNALPPSAVDPPPKSKSSAASQPKKKALSQSAKENRTITHSSKEKEKDEGCRIS